jgi:hypothetical protein
MRTEIERQADALRTLRLGDDWLVTEPLRSRGTPRQVVLAAMQRLRALRNASCTDQRSQTASEGRTRPFWSSGT